MSWIVTATGAEFDLRRPMPAAISALDIAAALSKICRFNGHTVRPYSVAEHSLLVCELAQREFAVQLPQALLAALLHDAHEAYCGDVSTPVKRVLGWAGTDLESPLENTVLHRFGVLHTARQWASVIKQCDLLALAIERRDLLPAAGTSHRPWPALEGIQPPGYVHLMEGHHATYIWADWRDVWLERFGELHYAVHGDREPESRRTLETI